MTFWQGLSTIIVHFQAMVYLLLYQLQWNAFVLFKIVLTCQQTKHHLFPFQ